MTALLRRAAPVAAIVVLASFLGGCAVYVPAGPGPGYYRGGYYAAPYYGHGYAYGPYGRPYFR